MVVYALISVDTDGVICDLVTRRDNFSKFVNSGRVGCEYNDFVISGDLSKFDDQGNSTSM